MLLIFCCDKYCKKYLTLTDLDWITVNDSKKAWLNFRTFGGPLDDAIDNGLNAVVVISCIVKNCKEFEFQISCKSDLAYSTCVMDTDQQSKWTSLTFVFNYSATYYVTSQVLQPKSVSMQYRGRNSWRLGFPVLTWRVHSILMIR